MSSVLLRGGRVLDIVEGRYHEDTDIRVEGGRIAELGRNLRPGPETRVIDLRGLTVMPGLIDAHVHAIGVVLDLHALGHMPPYLVAARAKGVLEGMLRRGFTAVRDAGGAERGLTEAVRQGHFEGPRLFPSGLALAQTGGQGDFRRDGETVLGCPACGGRRSISRVVDGVDAVRRAVREELAGGATQIKVMASGGMASGIPAERAHFSDEELRAMVDEAARCGTYVMAHAYENAAIRRCIEAGVRSIEHGSTIDGETAALMAERGAVLVPTLVVYNTLAEHGPRLGLSAEKVAVFERHRRNALESLERARAAGVSIGHGSDLEGEMHAFQSLEFRLKAEVMPPREVVASATIVNASLLGMEGRLGVVAEGAFADILALDGDPLNEVRTLSEPDRYLHLIMQGGRVVLHRPHL